MEKLFYRNEVSIINSNKEKRYLSDNAQLMKEWNYEKNINISPYNITLGSEKKVWWKCERGHEWEAVVYSRKINKCPICSGRKVLKGYNDLLTLKPQIAKEWHTEKNKDITPKEVTINSHKKVWWLGKCGHEWISSVSDRTRGRGCPICKSKKVVAGINDIGTTHPDIIKEWHPLNNKVKFTEILAQSNKTIWWICDKGHEYKTSPANRIAKRDGCPICSNKQILIGYNDLATTHPKLIEEWHPTRNIITPQEITFGSEKKIWWQCKEGHEWEAVVYSRKNNGCPYCSGNKVLVGYNDLATTHPELIKEWHPTKNNGISFLDISLGSNKKVWWKCKKGHEWKSVVHSRCSGCGCPICKEELKTSFPENVFFFYLKLVYKDIIKSYRAEWLGRMELDMYIPSLNIAIEYDGQAWHKNVEKDRYKNNLCIENGIRLIRIREPRCPKIDGEKIELIKVNDKNIKLAIEVLFIKYLSYNGHIDININRDRIQILNMISYHEKRNSFAEVLPEIAKEWHPTLNGDMKAEHVSFSSNKKIWWKCKNGHEWLDTCNHRKAGRGCPICSKQKSS